MKGTFINIRLALATAVCLFASQSMACEEVKGRVLADQGKLTGAFRLLENCAQKRGVSADTLMVLAKLYESPKATSMKKEDALKRAWSLKHKAAVHGNLEALIVITRTYALGDKKARILPDSEMHGCLVSVVHSAAGLGTYRSEDVVACLKG